MNFLKPKFNIKKQFSASILGHKAFIILATILSLGLATFGLFGNLTGLSEAAEGINKQISYQGKIFDSSGNTLANGDYDLKFTIYDAATGGNCLYTVAGTCGTPTSISVSVSSGYFSTLLGGTGHNAITLDFNDDTYWLGVTVENDPEMSPRKRIGSAGYSFNADTLDGLHASSFLRTDAVTTSTAQTIFATIPDGLGVHQGSLYVNPASASGNYTLFGAAVGASEKLRLDSGGNLEIQGIMTASGFATSTIDNIIIGGSTPLAGTFTDLVSTGHTDIGSNSADTLTISAYIDSNLVPNSNNDYDIGQYENAWKDIYASGTYYGDTVNAGRINATDTLVVSGSATSTFAGGIQSSHLYSTGGLTVVGGVVLPANSITNEMLVDTITASNYLPLTGGTLSGNLVFSGGAGLSTSTIDNVVIGGSTPLAGTFTTLVSTGHTDIGGAITDTLTINAGIDSFLMPASDGALDIGSSSNANWKDLYLSGIVYAGTGSFNGSISVETVESLGSATSTFAGGIQSSHLYSTGGLTVVGGVVLPANSITNEMLVDTITASNYLPLTGGTLSGNLVFSGSAGLSTSTIDNVVIGDSTPLAGTFTTLTSTGHTDIGSDNADTLTISAYIDSNLVPNSNNDYDIGQYENAWKDIYASGTYYGDTVNAGRINATDTLVVSGSATSTFAGGIQSSHLYSTGGLTVVGGVVLPANSITNEMLVDTITASNYLPLTGGTLSGNLVFSGGAGVSTSTLDNVVIGGSSATTGTFTGLTVNETLDANGIITLGDGGDTVVINSNDWGISTTGVITNASISVDQLTNSGEQLTAFDWADSEVSNTLTITSGSVDGVIIGGNSANAGTFTDLVSTGHTDIGSDNADTLTISAYIDSNLVPNSNNDYDIGQYENAWKDIYASGTYYGDTVNAGRINATDTLVVSGSATSTFAGGIQSSHLYSTGGLTVVGGVVLPANSITNEMLVDTITASNYLPLTGGTLSGNLVFSGGAGLSTSTIDNVVIGGSTPLAGTFTTLVSTGHTDIGGAITDTLTINAGIDSFLMPASDGALDIGSSSNANWKDLYLSGIVYAGTGSFNGSISVETVESLGSATSTFAGGIQSSHLYSTGGLTVVGGVVLPANSITNEMLVDTITASNYLPLTGGTLSGNLVFSGGAGLSTSTIDNVVIGGSTPLAGTFTTLVGTGNINLGNSYNDTLTINANIDSGMFASSTLQVSGLLTPYGGIATSTMDNIIIGGSTPLAGTFTALTVNTSVDFPAGSIPKDDLANSGALDFDWADGEISNTLTITSGSVDGVIIGGSTSASSTFTDMTITGNLTGNSIKGTFIGGLTGNVTGDVSGNAGTATALAGDPTDCGANEFANAIDASGNLGCSALVDDDVPNDITASNYLPLAGGTLSGNLVFSGSAGLSTSTIDNVVIGNSTPLAGTFTTLTSTGHTDIGSDNADTLTISAYIDSNLVPNSNNDYDIGQYENAWKDIYASGTYYGDTVNAGRINATDTLVVSGSATSTFAGGIQSSHLYSTGGLTVVGGVVLPANSITNEMLVDTITASNYLPLTGGTLSGNLVFSGGAGVSTSTLDNVVIGGSSATTGTFTGLTVNETLDANGIITLGDGGDTVVINSNDWGISTTGVITNASISVDQLTNSGEQLTAFDWADSEVSNTLTITSGSVDGVIIGGNSANAGTFTDLVSTGHTDIGSNSADTLTISAYIDSNLVPNSNNDYDIGQYENAWKDIYASGTYYGDTVNAGRINATDTLVVSGSATSTFAGGIQSSHLYSTGGLTVVGGVVLPANSITNEMLVDTITASNYLPLTGGTLSGNLVFSGGAGLSTSTIDNVVIGGSTPLAGTFTTLVSTGHTDIGNNNSDTLTITASIDSSVVFANDNNYDLGSEHLALKDIYASGTIYTTVVKNNPAGSSLSLTNTTSTLTNSLYLGSGSSIGTAQPQDGSLYVTGKAEFDGSVRFDSGIDVNGILYLADDQPLYFGDANARFLFSTGQTPDAMMFSTDALSNGIVIAENADLGTDFKHPLQHDPTIFIHSSSTTGAQEYAQLNYNKLLLQNYLGTATTTISSSISSFANDIIPSDTTSTSFGAVSLADVGDPLSPWQNIYASGTLHVTGGIPSGYAMGFSGPTQADHNILLMTKPYSTDFGCVSECASWQVGAVLIGNGTPSHGTEQDGSHYDTRGGLFVNGYFENNYRAYLDGNTYIGDATTDTLTLTAQINSNVIPNANNEYDIGAYDNAWKDIYASGTLYIGDTGTTSSIYSALEVGVLNVTTSTATSTFANGIKLNAGCIETANGNCVEVEDGEAGYLAFYSGSNIISDTSMVSSGIATPVGLYFDKGNMTADGPSRYPSLYPATNNWQDLGTPSSSWSNIYASGSWFGDLKPGDDDKFDLGISGQQWKDLHIDGTAHIDTLDVDITATITSTLTANGNIDLGSDSADTLTISAYIDSNLVPNSNNDYDIGQYGNAWKDIYASGTYYGDTVNAGRINATDTLVVSGSGTSTFTGGIQSSHLYSTEGLTVVGGVVLPNNSITNAMLVDTITASNYLPLTGGTLSGNLVFSGSAGLSTSTIDNVVIGDSTPLAGTFTTLTSTGHTDIGSDNADTLTISAYIDSNLVPNSNNDYDIGAYDNAWKDIYASGTIYGGAGSYTISDTETYFSSQVNTSGTLITQNFRPAGDNLYDLGASGAEWKDLYIDGLANIDLINIGAVNGSLIPDENSTHNLGTEVEKWKNFYTDNINASGTIISSNIRPGADDIYSLGAVGAEWNDLYIDGMAYIDTAQIGLLGIGTIDGNIIPNKDSDYNLGALGTEWANVYADAYPDIAETYNSIEGVEPGDVVISAINPLPDPENPGKFLATVEKHKTIFENTIVGVVTTQPGIILSETSMSIGQDNSWGTPERPNIALAGRVPVKVSTENGLIKAGDILVAASEPGRAMKWDPDYCSSEVPEFQTVCENTKQAAIIGMALEDFGDENSNEIKFGKVLTFLRSGFVSLNYNPKTNINLNITEDEFGNLITTGTFTAEEIITKSISSSENNWEIDIEGNFITKGVIKTEIETEDGEKQDMYAVTSPEAEFMLSGSAILYNGEVRILFKEGLQKIISTSTPIKVSITPTSPINSSVYVTEKDNSGFKIVMSNKISGDNGTLDWIAITRRINFENNENEINYYSENYSANPPIDNPPDSALDIEGCTNPIADNYNIEATIEDGSCIISWEQIPGCTDPTAINYSLEATVNDGSCSYILDNDGEEIEGCIYSEALNYNIEATIDNNSCVFQPEIILGCADPEASNYVYEATVDDGLCEYESTPESNETNEEAELPAGSSASPSDESDEIDEWIPIEGCTDPEADNYNPEATVNNESCIFETNIDPPPEEENNSTSTIQ